VLSRVTVSVHGRLIINRCAHTVAAALAYGPGLRFSLTAGEGAEPPADGDASSRRYAVHIRREGTFEESSDSAQRRAACELERAINEWAEDPQHEPLLAEGERWDRAIRTHQFETAIKEADKDAAAARARRREAIGQLAELVADEAELRRSRIGLPEAVRHYREYLDRELSSLYALLDSGEPVDPRALEAALLGLERLIKLDHGCEQRAQNMRLWDTIEALHEAPHI
jgi:hypothetical protein